MLEKFPGNVQEYSSIVKILGKALEDSGEWSKKFQGMFKKIPGRLKTIRFSFLSLIEEKV